MSSSLEKRDPLTGLFNRREGLAILSNSVEEFNSVALLFCDLDHFRCLNEVFGHLHGDEELRRIARDLERICAPFPIFRFGGDEYCIVLQEVSLQQAHDVAAQILASQPPRLFSSAGEAPSMSFSIGIALFPTHALNAEHLLRAADVALFKVKRGGRLPDGTRYTNRNRALAWGDFLDEFPHESAQFINPVFLASQQKSQRP